MSTDVQELTAKAKTLVSERKYPEAVRICRRVLLSHPDEREIRVLLGLALLALKRYEEARVELMALARVTPKDPTVHRLLGETYLRDSKPDRAKESLRLALALDPNDHEAAALLKEVDDEPSGSQTLDRWFDPDAVATVQTGAPAFEEEKTPVPGRGLAPPVIMSEDSSVEIDPSLSAEVNIERFDAPPHGASPSSPPPGSSSPPRAPPPRRPRAPSSYPAPSAGALAQPMIYSRADDVITNPREENVTRVRQDLEITPQPPVVRPLRKPLPPKESTQELDLEEMGAIEDELAFRGIEEEETEEKSDLVSSLTNEKGVPVAIESQKTRARNSPTGYAPIADEEDEELEELDPDSTNLRPVGLRPDGEVTRQAAGSSPRQRIQTPYPAMPEPVPAPPPTRPAPGGGPTRPLPASSAQSDYDYDQPIRPAYGAPPIVTPPASGRPRYPSRPPSSRPARGLPEYVPQPVMPAPIAPASMEVFAEPQFTPTGGNTPAGPTTARPMPGTGGISSSATGPRAASSGAVTQHGVLQPSRGVAAILASPQHRRTATIGVAVTAPLLVGLIAFFGIRSCLAGEEEAEVATATQRASDDGLRTSLDQALSLAAQDDDPTRLALAARLLATLTYEHNENRTDDAQRLLATLEADETLLGDAKIARAYLLLARGEVEPARTLVADVQGSGELAAEANRVRALAAAAAGDYARAVVDARAAVQLRPTSPRHVALYALITAQTGDPAAALNYLGIPGGESSPAIRLARARVLQESGGDPARADAEARAVLEELSQLATPAQRGWAHLVRARHAANTAGDFPAAVREGEAATHERPIGDEAFGLALIETFLAADAALAARAELEALPLATRERERRARLTAEVALEVGDYRAATAALAEAGSTPRTALLRGRLAEAQGRPDQARVLYLEAQRDDREFVRASARLGQMLLVAGQANEAVSQLEPASRRNQKDLEVIPLLVRAYLAIGQVDRARDAVRAALSQRPNAPEFLGASGEVELASGDTQAALRVLRDAARLRANDPLVLAGLGDAARIDAAQRGIPSEEAQRSYDEALRQAPNLAKALAGLVELAIDQCNEPEARQRLANAERFAPASLEVVRARARFEVFFGTGEAAIPDTRAVVEARNDAQLLIELGRLQVQAERDRDAWATFGRALEIDEGLYEAYVGRAMIQIRRGDLAGARQSLQNGERNAEARRAPAAFRARLLTVRGWLSFEENRTADAQRSADAALERDPRCADAHFLLATLADLRGQDPVPFLRRASTGRAPPPEAIGQLVIKLPASSERCLLANRYLATAPIGVDAPSVRSIAAGCPPPPPVLPAP